MLKQLQTQFAEVLEQRHFADQFTLSQPSLSTTQAMQIYQNNYLLSLIEALRASYPSVLKLVGEDYFHFVAKQFVLQCGHDQGDLNLFGLGFAQFLAKQSGLGHLPYLPAMAELDWRIERCAAQPLPEQYLSLEQLQAQPSQHLGNAILPLASNVMLITSAYPVFSIYQMLQQDQVKPIELDHAQYLLLIKQTDFSVQLELLTEQQYAFLAHCQQQAPLVELPPNCIAQLQTLLAKAIEQHYLANLIQPTAEAEQ